MSVLWLWLVGAHALHLELSPGELCEAVDLVVVAQVVDVEHRYAADGTLERLVHATVE